MEYIGSRQGQAELKREQRDMSYLASNCSTERFSAQLLVKTWNLRAPNTESENALLSGVYGTPHTEKTASGQADFLAHQVQVFAVIPPQIGPVGALIDDEEGPVSVFEKSVFSGYETPAYFDIAACASPRYKSWANL